MYNVYNYKETPYNAKLGPTCTIFREYFAKYYSSISLKNVHAGSH